MPRPPPSGATWLYCVRQRCNIITHCCWPIARLTNDIDGQLNKCLLTLSTTYKPREMADIISIQLSKQNGGNCLLMIDTLIRHWGDAGPSDSSYSIDPASLRPIFICPLLGILFLVGIDFCGRLARRGKCYANPIFCAPCIVDHAHPSRDL